MAGASSIHGTTFAFFVETNQGEPPGYSVSVPQGTSAAWASAEGTNCYRHIVHEADPGWIQATDIENPQLVTGVLAENVPIAGVVCFRTVGSWVATHATTVTKTTG